MVAQWRGVHLPMLGTQVQSLIWGTPACCRVCLSSWLRVVPKSHHCAACSPADVSCVLLETRHLAQLSTLLCAPATLMDQHHQRRPLAALHSRPLPCSQGRRPVSVGAASAPEAPSPRGDPDNFPALLFAGRPARSQPLPAQWRTRVCPPRNPGGRQSLVA